jgi:putative NADH-flavin reductase
MMCFLAAWIRKVSRHCSNYIQEFNMKIALIGATGFIGSALLEEALARGHQVTALVAHPEKLQAQDNLAIEQSDVLDGAKLAAQLKGHDAVISAFSGHAQQDVYGYYMKGVNSIIAATKQASIKRLLIVGGAGSLYAQPGVLVIDTPDFPQQWKATAQGARDVLTQLRNESDLDWSMLSPSAIIEPGERTGTFRQAGDELIVDAGGQSRISTQDFALAMIDELETPRHVRARFTVGY